MKHFGSLRLAAAFVTLAMIVGAGSPAVAADTYKLGYITDFSGPFVDTFKPVFQGFELYMKRVNAAGGINGHKVEIITRDDQLNAQRAASHARELITSQKVNSLWAMSMSSTLPGVYRVAKRNKVPAISSVSAIGMTLPPAAGYAYSTGNPFNVAGEVAGKLAAKLFPGKGRMTCVTIESAGGFAACAHTEASFKAQGFTVSKVFFSPRKVEFGPLGQKIAGTKPKLVVTHLPPRLTEGVMIHTRAGGYKGPMLMNNVSISEAGLIQGIEKAGSAEGVYTFSRYTLAHEETADLAEIKATAKKFGMNPDEIAVNHVIGWVNAKLASAALKKCGWPCSGEAMNKALANISVDMGKLTGGPITFKSNDHQGTSWWKVYKFDAGSNKFKPVTEWVAAPSTLQYKITK
ncbi:MAG TPA: ABC transporter substrate-binding protein [Thermohalobaculum sp.]|nr:ABC transporter substrate-binding protein [Thermohalobaculum sp.]